MADLPALRLLLQGYLSLDWPDDYQGDPWAAVDDFASSEPDAGALPDEVRAMLSRDMNEDALRQVVVGDLGSGYLPDADGWTYSDWLTEVSRRVHSKTHAD